MSKRPSLLTFAAGILSVSLAFYSPVWAWVPLLLWETSFVKLLRFLRHQKVNTVQQLSEKANQLLQLFPQNYWEAMPGVMYLRATGIAGAMGLIVGVVGAFKGSWISLAIGLINLIVMFALGPQFDLSVYFSPEYAAAHKEVVAYVRQGASEQN